MRVKRSLVSAAILLAVGAAAAVAQPNLWKEPRGLRIVLEPNEQVLLEFPAPAAQVRWMTSVPLGVIVARPQETALQHRAVIETYAPGFCVVSATDGVRTWQVDIIVE